MPNRAFTVLVTGASTGIGRATALYLDHLGWRVFATVRRSADEEVLRHEASDRITPLHLDVSDREAIRAAAWQVEQSQPSGLDGLVNNAGVAIAGPLEVLPLDAFREQLEVNTVGQLAITQAFLPSIRKRRGRIVNVSSINGRIASPFNGAYAASKFALEAMSDALRIELAHWGIHVVVVQPGAIRTAIRDTAKARAEDTFGHPQPRAAELYGKLIHRLLQAAGTSPARTLPPDRVARVIHTALTTRRPRTRYLVGWDARIGALLAWLLPDRWMDRILTL